MATQHTSKQWSEQQSTAPVEPPERAPPGAPPAEPAHSEAPPPEASSGRLECAKTGRARCRACGETLARGQLRCGEQVPNPFGEGTTTYWFHPRCAAERRPESFLSAEQASPELSDADELQGLRALAEFGATHPRAARLSSVGVAPSGRARCRCCRELIEKGMLRTELSIFQDGRFDPMGYLHLACLGQYVGAPLPWSRMENKCADLTEEQRELVRTQCCADDGESVSV